MASIAKPWGSQSIPLVTNALTVGTVPKQPPLFQRLAGAAGDDKKEERRAASLVLGVCVFENPRPNPELHQPNAWKLPFPVCVVSLNGDRYCPGRSSLKWGKLRQPGKGG